MILNNLFQHKLFKTMSWGTVTMLLTFVQGVVIARCYGPELRGFAAVPIVFFGLVLPLTSFGLKQSISFYFAKKGLSISAQTFNKLNLLVLLFSLLMISLFFLNEPDYVYFFVPIVGYFLFKVYAEVQSYKFLITKNVHKLNGYNFVRVSVELLLLYLLYALSLDEHLLLYCYFIGAICYFLLVIKFDVRSCGESIDLVPVSDDKLDVKLKNIVYKGISFALPLTFIGLNLSFDILMLSRMKSLNSVGIYQVAVTIANLVWIIPTLIIPYLFSNALYSSLPQVMGKLKLLILIILLTLPVIFLMTPYSKVVFTSIYGVEFSDSADVFNIIIFGFYIMLVYKFVNPFLAANGYTKFAAFVFIGGFVVNIFLNLLLIPELDYFGAAISTLVSYFLCSIVFVLYTLRLEKRLCQVNK